MHRHSRVATANGHVNGNNDRKPTDENGYPMFRETCISEGKYASYGLIEANSNSEPYTVYLCNYGMPSLPMCLYICIYVLYICTHAHGYKHENPICYLVALASG